MTNPSPTGESGSVPEKKRKPRIRWVEKSRTLFIVEGEGFDRSWRVDYLTHEGTTLRRLDGWYWFWKGPVILEREGPYKTSTAAKRAKARYDGY